MAASTSGAYYSYWTVDKVPHCWLSSCRPCAAPQTAGQGCRAGLLGRSGSLASFAGTPAEDGCSATHALWGCTCSLCLAGTLHCADCRNQIGDLNNLVDADPNCHAELKGEHHTALLAASQKPPWAAPRGGAPAVPRGPNTRACPTALLRAQRPRSGPGTCNLSRLTPTWLSAARARSHDCTIPVRDGHPTRHL